MKSRLLTADGDKRLFHICYWWMKGNVIRLRFRHIKYKVAA